MFVFNLFLKNECRYREIKSNKKTIIKYNFTCPKFEMIIQQVTQLFSRNTLTHTKIKITLQNYKHKADALHNFFFFFSDKFDFS